MPTTYAAFDVPPHRVPASRLPPPARRDQRRRRTVSAERRRSQAGMKAFRIVCLAGGASGWRTYAIMPLDGPASADRLTPYEPSTVQYCAVGWAACRTEGGALHRPSVCLSVCSPAVTERRL